MTDCKLCVRIEFKWWLKPYVASLFLFASIFGTEPDPDKLTAIIKKGCKATLCRSKHS